MKSWVLGIVLLLIFNTADAHKTSDSYLSLTVHGHRIQGKWDIALRDLEDAIGLDQNGDGAITWRELRDRHDAIAAYALPRLGIHANGVLCPSDAPRHLVDKHADGAYAVVQFQATCPNPPISLEVEYQLLFDINPQHRGLLRLDVFGQTQAMIFSPEQNRRKILLQATTSHPVRSFLDFCKEGIWHFLRGFDHLLFLLTLLLPSVLQRHGREWHAVEDFRPMAWNLMKIITSFTVAHSMTLSLAVIGMIRFPSQWIEAAIALSVIVAAVDNLYPILKGRRWVFAFSFGLVHGCGLAGALLDLELSGSSLALSLMGFNIGVEMGQLMVIALFFPLIYGLRKARLYRPAALVFGSSLIVIVASVWLIERLFNMNLLPSF